jgi:hypothetical protein
MSDVLGRLWTEVLRKQGEVVPMALFTAAQQARAECVRQIHESHPFVPVDTGQMARSYEVVRTPTGARLQNTAEHAAFMEYGTRPHVAPLEPLLAWARRKLRGMGKPGGGKQGPIKRYSKDEKERAAQALARKAWRKIARFGTEPRGFHARASQQFPEFVERALLYELNRLAISGPGRAS